MLEGGWFRSSLPAESAFDASRDVRRLWRMDLRRTRTWCKGTY